MEYVTLGKSDLRVSRICMGCMGFGNLREKYNLHMKVERYISNDEIPEADKKFIKE